MINETNKKSCKKYLIFDQKVRISVNFMNLEVVLLFLEDRCLNEVITFLNFSLMNYSIEIIMTLIVP